MAGIDVNYQVLRPCGICDKDFSATAAQKWFEKCDSNIYMKFRFSCGWQHHFVNLFSHRTDSFPSGGCDSARQSGGECGRQHFVG